MDATVGQVRAALLKIDGVVESPGTFHTDTDAFWVNGKEIAHFDSDGSLELRVTGPVIRAHRDRLRSDPEIERRAPSSDWITMRYSSARDVAFVAELAELAAAAHRPSAGAMAKPPPTGAALERRRRFH